MIGASSVSFNKFAIGTLALFPIVIFWVYVGTTMSNIEDAINGSASISTAEIVVMVIGTTLALGGLIYVTCLVRK